MFGKRLFPAILLSSLSLLLPTFGQAVKVDSKIGPYQKVSGVSGKLNSVGSDTLNNLMTLWAESFMKNYPNIKIQIEGKGSSTAPPALIESIAQIGPMSRKMKDSEVDKFEAKFGYKPTPIRVAIDALAVFVNKDNPVTGLSMQKVDAIFSSTRKGGNPSDITTWDQAGVVQWGGKPIRLYGRNSASGTYGYFKSKALFKGDYKNTVKEQPGSASVVQGITEDMYAIGYSGIGYKTSGVRTVPLSRVEGGDAYSPDQPENVFSGKYPLSRFLYLNINKAPNESVSPLVGEFIKFVLSKEGQEIVVKDGYLPIPASIASTEAANLN